MKLFEKESGKKGQLSIGFNWIFVLIVGAVILGFFFTAISSGSKSSEQKISVSLAKHFETIIFSSGQQPGTLKTYTTPEVTLTFTCNDEELYYNYFVGDLKARDTKYDILFSPKTLFGESIITWTQNWDVPYTVATVMYITNKNHLFVFENTKNLSTKKFRDITSNFPQNITQYHIDADHSAQEIPLGYTHYTYVLFANETELSFSDILDEERVQIILIYPAKNDVFAYGDIFFLTPKEFSTFRLNNYDIIADDMPSTNFDNLGELSEEFTTFNKPSNQIQSKEHTGYIGKASLYGAIFSENKAMYECAMNKARHRLLLLTILQKNRIQVIEDDVSHLCKESLGLLDIAGPHTTLQQIELLASKNFFDFRSLPDLYMRGIQLQNQNDKLSVLGNCPTVY